MKRNMLFKVGLIIATVSLLASLTACPAPTGSSSLSDGLARDSDGIIITVSSKDAIFVPGQTSGSDAGSTTTSTASSSASK